MLALNTKNVLIPGIRTSYFCSMVRLTGLEPARREATDPKSVVSANFTTGAFLPGYYTMISEDRGIMTHMDKLEENRAVINETDAELVRLFERRMHAVKEIIAYKLEHDLPILDSGREAVIMERNSRLLEDPELEPFFREWYAETIAVSKAYQQMIKGKDE